MKEVDEEVPVAAPRWKAVARAAITEEEEETKKQDDEYANPTRYYPPFWPDNPFHDGEVKLQQKSGAQEHIMTYAPDIILPFMPLSHRTFYEALPFLIIAVRDSSNDRMWCTLLFEPSVTSPDPQTLVINTQPLEGDAIGLSELKLGADISILGMDWGQKQRNKVNGRIVNVANDNASFSVKVDQAIPHCPKYIEPRQWKKKEEEALGTTTASAPSSTRSTKLSPTQIQALETAEAIFVATGYRGEGEDPRFGNDVQFRGGAPGYLRVVKDDANSAHKIIIPEFPGNHHFNTLGNLVMDSHMGLVLPLFETGGMIQIAGTAVFEDVPKDHGNDNLSEDFTNPQYKVDLAVPETMIVLTVQEVVELPEGSMPLTWNKIDTSVPSRRARRRSTLKQVAAEFHRDDEDDFMNQVRLAVENLRPYRQPLTSADQVLVMQGWNKVLAYKSSFAEALWLRWRLMVAVEELEDDVASDDLADGNAFHLVEQNRDPLALCLGGRVAVMEEALLFCIDTAIRSLCPHTQTIQREAYRPLQDDQYVEELHQGEIRLDCRTLADHLKSFARLGVLPSYWVSFVESFRWALRTHTPYFQDDDQDDLEKYGGYGSAYLRAIVKTFALPAIKEYKELKALTRQDLYAIHLPSCWNNVTADDHRVVGEKFYGTLFEKYPETLDYFSSTDMDTLAPHFAQAVGTVCNSAAQLGSAKSSFRKVLNHLAEIHRKMNVPTYTYPIVGVNLAEVMKETMEEEVKRANGKITFEELSGALMHLYTEVMSVVYYPMLREEQMMKAASEFYRQVQAELNWTTKDLERRLFEIENEIHATGTYTQTSEELELGARLAWRNSAKCIGRVSWNTLMVRDCRHVKQPDRIFREIHEHLQLATAQTNIQSVMTVFAPLKPNRALGTRFWSSQIVRYACYKDTETGKVLGDPANLELTDYLVEKGKWVPPEPKTAFDPLPLVLKVPGRADPIVHALPEDLVFQVDIEHPTNLGISDLGYRWCTVPALTNFRMNIGGIVYPNIPFNGWFVSTEITRNLIERYDAAPVVAEKLGLDVSTHPMYRQLASAELETAIIHSFQKNGYTIVDPHSVGESLCSHVKREREQNGRECPGQWSWIGGLVGPTNPTWHLEMRDFLVNPQYEYCVEGLLLHSGIGDQVRPEPETNEGDTTARNLSIISERPRVLILYGSETGKAESIAHRLKRQLRLLKPLVLSLGEAAGLEIAGEHKITHILSICSTYGKGSPPFNAKEFFTQDIQELESVKFSVLALGSSIYPDFCKAGRELDRLLENAGLERLSTISTADDVAGSEGVIESWLMMAKASIIPPSLEIELAELASISSTGPPKHEFVWHDAYQAANRPAGSKCIENFELVSNASKRDAKSIRQISFEVPEGSSYTTGDHLTVLPVNSDSSVNRFLACFRSELLESAKALPSCPESDEDAIMEWLVQQGFGMQVRENNETSPADIFFKCPVSLYELAKYQLDYAVSQKNAAEIVQVMKDALDVAASDKKKEWKEAMLSDPLVNEFMCICSPLLEKSGDERGALVDELVAQYPTVVDLLEHFRPAFLQSALVDEQPLLKMAEVLVVMSRLQPRYYSISSSSRIDTNKITISVGVLRLETSKGAKIEGVCSNYLASLKPGSDEAIISVVQSSFRLPHDLKAPLIMVGTGTGIAPLYAFLQDRELDRAEGKKLGEIHLFYGCRTKDDFIYKEKITEHCETGLLNLHLALSRSSEMPTKTYVQDVIAGPSGKAVSDLLGREDTHYFVCGDARMAEACFEACVSSVREHQRISRVNATNKLRVMESSGRWLTDVWGVVYYFESSKKAMEKQKKAAAKFWLEHFQKDKELNLV